MSTDPTYEDNPSDENEFAKMKDSGQRFRVTSDGLGGHQQGAVVSAKDLGRGASLDRLIMLGAVIPMDEAESRAHVEAGVPAHVAADRKRADPRVATGGVAPAPALDAETPDVQPKPPNRPTTNLQTAPAPPPAKSEPK